NQLVATEERGRVITMTTSVPSLSMVFGSFTSAFLVSRLGLGWLLGLQLLAFAAALFITPWAGATQLKCDTASQRKQFSHFRAPAGVVGRSPLTNFIHCLAVLFCLRRLS
ncbi:MAG: hypothetical protein Q3965_04180, partial [Rothia sp. (in: high G+C Gram-positive bacteria)]|nr:hypothetical protein [Rothia sp. (in: high G+C Gram-positive bacteria)]